MRKNKIILDTDPGIDDAIAIIVLLSECSERVDLILSSYGNISVEYTTQNALMMLSLLKSDIPVVKGTHMPNNKNYTDASHIHGVDGLGGLNVDVSTRKAIEGDYLQITYDRIIKAGMVDYITLGPLTNLALLIKRFPDVVSHIEKVVSMGGGMDRGNVTKFAEFNIYCDAESASYVFSSIKEIVLVPLNITSTVAFNLEQIEAIGRFKTPIAKAMEQILTENYHCCSRYGNHGSTMHDATAVLYYLYPELFTVRKCGIEVDCSERYGQTRLYDNQNNVTLALETNPELLLVKITDCIK
ncbi:MAG: nucleoside hydrolase [Oscillospiraceae bacterium]